jgi:hypothetical protein
MAEGERASLATLATSTAALALLTALSAARADELQVNQQLLNERIDQLAGGLFVGPSVPGSLDPNPAAGSLVTGGSYPRSILIPGTETSIKLSGQIREDLDYWFTGGPPNNSPQTGNVGATGWLEQGPLRDGRAAARGDGIFSQTPSASRFAVETRTPTALGEVRTYVEFAFGGSSQFAPGGNVTQVDDSLIPDLRYAYATLGEGLLVGQATSNFSDPDANAETLDFGGPVGMPGVTRIPQIRYTMRALWGASFSVSAETSETDVASGVGWFASDSGAGTPNGPVAAGNGVVGNLPYATNPAKATAPDLTAAYDIPQPWGHLDISAVLRPGLDMADGKYLSRDFIGYGGHVGASVKPDWFGWGKDGFTAQFEAGNGIGRYINANSSAALATNYTVTPASPAAATLVVIRPVTEIGGTLGYRHFWMDNLRSTIVGGVEGINLPVKIVAAAGGLLNDQLVTWHTNLIWNPVSSVDIGVEYMWGKSTAINNRTGTESVLISRFRIMF